MTITILGAPRTGKNGMSVVRLKNGRTMSIKKKSLQEWDKNADKQITGIHRKEFRVPCNISIRVWIDADRRCDLVGFIQAALDMLVRNKVIVDDSGNNPAIAVTYNGSKIEGVDRKNPRMEIVITPLEVEETKPVTGFET